MFLRWKKRKILNGSDQALDAVLVISKREDGRIKQNFVKYLGSIRERYMESLGFQIRFWEKAEQALDSLRLNLAIRSCLERQLMAKVPRPKECERRQYKKRLEEEFEIAMGLKCK